jgi:pimeloyl-ACP methyl ester carboxylesterase
VGHDVGGGVAVHLASLAPSRVAALVLVDSPLHADTWPVPAIRALATPFLGEVQGGLMRLVPDAGARYLASQLARGLRATELSARSAALYAAPLLSADGSRGLLSLIRAADPAAVEAAFDVVRLDPPPTLVLWADGDAWFSPAVGRRIAGDVPGASYVEVADAGHFLPEDRPERVAEELAGFLAELPVPA